MAAPPDQRRRADRPRRSAGDRRGHAEADRGEREILIFDSRARWFLRHLMTGASGPEQGYARCAPAFISTRAARLNTSIGALNPARDATATLDDLARASF